MERRLPGAHEGPVFADSARLGQVLPSILLRQTPLRVRTAMSSDGQDGLRNKVTLITGGTSGIGRDAAILFATHNAKVVVAGRREAEGRETLELLRKAGGEGLF